MCAEAAIDAVLGAAVVEAVSRLRPRASEAGEEALRAALVGALRRRRAEWVVDTERRVSIPEFQGVGPVDIVLRESVEAAPRGLIECKWSTDARRDKIFEGAWDAVKLALATRERNRHGWLVTGAPTASWSTSETSDLFAAGSVDTQELWSRPLLGRGANGGRTVGEDCELGGRGNMFTHAPATLEIVPVASARTLSGDWEIRAARVSGRGPLIRFAEAPEFPERIDQRWLIANISGMEDAMFERLLTRLRQKRWTDAEIATRVSPLRMQRPQG